MYGGIELTIEGTSLRMNFSYPGSDTAYVYSYQFRYDGKSVVLANMELQSFYHGDGERDEQNADYSVSVNYVTGEVSDSRDKSGTRKKGRLKKITLEGFSPGMEYTDEIAEGQ
jgi:hypothetical protein